MTGRVRALAILVCAVFLTAREPAGAGAPLAAEPAPPKLVVILVVDQMRADYFDRYGHQWTAGLQRLAEQGAWFRLAAYPYMNTVTCPGHATIATGAYPRSHGIPLNEWWDRAAGRLHACTEDPTAPLVSYGRAVQGGESATALRLPTLADEMRAHLPVTPRVVTVSLKARSAVMLAGRRADAATWFDDEGVWVTSTAFASAPVPFVQHFMAANPMERQLDAIWRRLLEPGAYLFDDAGAGERPVAGWTTVFPHPLRGDGGPLAESAKYDRWDHSPFSDDYLGRLAEDAVDELKLGQSAGIDYLAVGFSALDRIGHPFGPSSHEVQDTLVRLDRTIGRLLDHLDRSVGRDRYVLAFTADHGVSPIVEQVQARGLAAARLSTRKIGDAVSRALEPFLGPGQHVARMVYTDLYFAPGVYEQLVARPAAMQAAVDALLATEGIARVYRKDDLFNCVETADSTRRAAALSYVEGRSGDLVVVPAPYFNYSSEATTHGTSYQYDTRVPLILVGSGIRPGEYLTPATPADVVPTLAFRAGVTVSSAEGRVLSEAIDASRVGQPKTAAGRRGR